MVMDGKMAYANYLTNSLSYPISREAIASKKVFVTPNKLGSKKEIFTIFFRNDEFQIVKKATQPFLLFENLCYSPIQEAFF